MLELFSEGTTLLESVKIIEELEKDETRGISMEDARKLSAIKDLLGKKVSYVVNSYVATIN